jgi:hypothetical protein
MAERSKAHAWRACWGAAPRGFESHSLRQYNIRINSLVGYRQPSQRPTPHIGRRNRNGPSHPAPSRKAVAALWRRGFDVVGLAINRLTAATSRPRRLVVRVRIKSGMFKASAVGSACSQEETCRGAPDGVPHPSSERIFTEHARAGSPAPRPRGARRLASVLTERYQGLPHPSQVFTVVSAIKSRLTFSILDYKTAVHIYTCLSAKK